LKRIENESVLIKLGLMLEINNGQQEGEAPG